MEYIWEHQIPKKSPSPLPLWKEKNGVIGWEGFSISNSVDRHLWPKLMAGALV
jgi:hypothetical protein